jgi:NhaA family Na+:H+ antiporter
MLGNINTKASAPTNKDRLNITELPQNTVLSRPSLRRSGAAEQALDDGHHRIGQGALTWLAVDASGIHATVTGVILGLLTPTRRWVSDERLRAILDRVVAYPADHWSGDTEDRKALRLAEVAARETLSPVERLEIMLHPWVGFVIMPLFAFANAGVPISAADLRDPIATAVFFGLTLGKPVGVISFSWLAVRSGIALRPPSLDWGMVAGGGMLAGIGFTMALFIAGLAFGDDHLNAAKVGILSASVVSAVLGTALLAWLSSSRRVEGPSRTAGSTMRQIIDL